MKAEIAKKWVKALRSGRYQQGKQALKVKSKRGITRHCCLGVLCELYQNAHRGKKLKSSRRRAVKGDDISTGATIFGFENMPFPEEEMTLPASVRRWAGIKSDDGWIDYDVDGLGSSTLAEMNDKGASFSKIADIIETRSETI